MRNLLTNEEKKAVRREYRWRLISLLSGTLLVTAIIGVVCLVPSYVLSGAKYRIAAERNIAVGAESTTNKIQAAKTTLLEVAAKEVYVSGMLSRVLPTEIIDAIVAQKGSAISLEGFVFKQRTASEEERLFGIKANNTIPGELPLAFQNVSITGVARDRTSLTAFAKRLENVSIIAFVDVPVSNFEKGRGIDFSITVTLKHPSTTKKPSSASASTPSNQ